MTRPTATTVPSPRAAAASMAPSPPPTQTDSQCSPRSVERHACGSEDIGESSPGCAGSHWTMADVLDADHHQRRAGVDESQDHPDPGPMSGPATCPPVSGDRPRLRRPRRARSGAAATGHERSRLAEERIELVPGGANRTDERSVGLDPGAAIGGRDEDGRTGRTVCSHRGPANGPHAAGRNHWIGELVHTRAGARPRRGSTPSRRATSRRSTPGDRPW